MINLKTTERTGKVVAIKSVVPGDQLMVITRNGIINRQGIDEIRVIGRATQGVRLVNLDDDDSVMDVARVIPEDPTEALAVSVGAADGEAPEGQGMDGEGADGEGAGASVDSGTGEAVGMDADMEGE